MKELNQLAVKHSAWMQRANGRVKDKKSVVTTRIHERNASCVEEGTDRHELSSGNDR